MALSDFHIFGMPGFRKRNCK